jgi:hypothetical protein
MQKSAVLIFGLVLLINFTVVSAICTDSDGGKKLGVPGITSGTFIYDDGTIAENYTAKDFCLVAGGTFKYVEEGYCENGVVKQEGMECAYKCSEGACREESYMFPEEPAPEELDEGIKNLFIFDNIGRWYLPNDSVQVSGSSYSECLQRNITAILGGYYADNPYGYVTVIFYPDFSADIDTSVFLNDIAKCIVSQDAFKAYKIKKYNQNPYFYAESKTTATFSDGNTREITYSNYMWYNGNKVLGLLIEKQYDAQADDLLSAYFEKYPSELTVPPGLFQGIIDFFKRLFGKA